MEEQNNTLDIGSLLVKTGSTPHEIEIDPEDQPGLMLKVWVKELSFMEMQEAVKQFVSMSTTGEVDIDMAKYWKYIFIKCIEKTEPEMSKTQMLALKTSAAVKIASLLPQPQDLVLDPLVDGMGE